MEPLADQLAVLIGRLRLFQAKLIHRGYAVEAAQVQYNLVERIQRVVLQIDGTLTNVPTQQVAAKSRFPRSGTDSERPKKVSWTCCSPPKKVASRNGQSIWVANCTWKQGKRTGQTLRLVGRGKQKPKTLKLGRHRLKKC